VVDHRRRPARSPWRVLAVLVAAMVALTVLVAGARAVVARATQPDPTPTPSPTPTGTASPAPTSASPSPTPTGPAQVTVLLQVRDDTGLAHGNLLATSRRASASGTVVGVQPQLLVNVPGGTQALFETTSLGTDAGLSQTTLSNLLGVRVDATWTLDRLALAGLVDSIGGIYLDVRVPVQFTDDAGALLVELEPGIQRLDGTTAAAYALALQTGEPETARMARFAEVMRQVLLSLPEDPARVELLLGSLGALSRTTVPADELASMLQRLGTDVDDSRLERYDLPVTVVGSGSVTADRLRFLGAEELMQRDFAEARVTPGADRPVRVVVFNGTSRPSLESTAREPVEAIGDVFLTGGRPTGVGYTESTVTVQAGVRGAATWATRVARALGLPATAVRISSDPGTTADVAVILGADYRPATPPTPEPTRGIEPTDG